MSQRADGSLGGGDPDATALRVAVVGLIWFAAGAEEMLLTQASAESEVGEPGRWAAVPTVAHNAEFREEQVTRLHAVCRGRRPQDFPRIDHRADAVYRRYCSGGMAVALRASRDTTEALTDGLLEVSESDLLDPSRHAWLRGRQLWLQVVVRGFWHPTAHVGDYYLAHHQGRRALALHRRAVAVARNLQAPAPALGMALYSLGCAQVNCGRSALGIRTLGEAFRRNGDLREHARGDPDLANLVAQGRLEVGSGSA
ncbi:MAG: hypothetical protein ACREN7_10785 [Candidatus Dormibacteria bacterium]